MEDSQIKISMSDAMALTGFSRGTFYNRIKAEQIKPLPKPPGYGRRPVLYFHRADVERLLTS